MKETWSIKKMYGEDGLIHVVEWSLEIVDDRGSALNSIVTKLNTPLPQDTTKEGVLKVLNETVLASLLDNLRSHSLSVIEEKAQRSFLYSFSDTYFIEEGLLEKEVRSKRDTLLSETDWMVAKQFETGVTDTGLTSYRQALRDITSQEGFPNNIVWPTKP